MKIKQGLNLHLIVVTIFALILGILNPVVISKNNVKANTYRNELPENEVVTLNENQLTKIEFYLLNPLTKNQNDAVSKITNGGKYEDGKLLYRWEAEPTNYNEDLINTIEYDGVNQPKIEITKLYFENDVDEIYYSFDDKDFFNKYFDFHVTFDKNKPLLIINIKGKTDFLKFEKSVEFSKFINEPIENVYRQEYWYLDNENSKDKKTPAAKLKFCETNVINFLDYVHVISNGHISWNVSDGNLYNLLNSGVNKKNIGFKLVLDNKNAFKLDKKKGYDIGFKIKTKQDKTWGTITIVGKPYCCGSCYLKVYDKNNSKNYDMIKVFSTLNYGTESFYEYNNKETIDGIKKIGKNKAKLRLKVLTNKISNFTELDYKRYFIRCSYGKNVKYYKIDVNYKNYKKKYHYQTINIKGLDQVDLYADYIFYETNYYSHDVSSVSNDPAKWLCYYEVEKKSKGYKKKDKIDWGYKIFLDKLKTKKLQKLDKKHNYSNRLQ